MRFVDEQLDALRRGSQRTRTPTSPADCRPTCTSATFRRTTCFAAADDARRVDAGVNWPAEATGSREGWWGMSASAEAFLDQLVTWRELGYNFCTSATTTTSTSRCPTGPARRWQSTPRTAVSTFTRWPSSLPAPTHDPLWNAAQSQLRTRRAGMHNYLRMLWGKKILEWTPTPRGSAGDHDRPERPLRRRRPRPELVLAASAGCWGATIAPGAPSGQSSAKSAT